MPADFLTALERQRYQNLPADLREEDLQASCWLTPADQQLVAQQRRGGNRLGFAVQLGVLRLLGYLPPEWYRQVSDSLVQFVARQLELDPALFQAYGEREATLTEHLRVLLSHLQVRRWQPVLDAPWLEAWLVERALEHDNERLLLTLALGHLRQHGILRPGIVELERLVGALAERAQAETYRRLLLLLTPEVVTQLDALLVVDPALGLCRHTWLHQPPTSSSATSIQQVLGKLAYLDQLGVPDWQAPDLHPNRQKRLAHTARNKTNQVLQRFTPAKRHPLLVAACREAYRDLTDMVLKMVDEHWEHAVARARRALQDDQLAHARAKDQALRTLGQAVGLVMDEEHVPDEALREQIYAQVPRAQLQAALTAVADFARPARHSYLDYLLPVAARLNTLLGSLLQQVAFEQAFADDDFADALALVKELHMGQRRKLPEDAATAFIPASWRAFVFDPDGRAHRPRYGLCVLATLRERLRAGDVVVNASRKYASLDTYLLSPAEWARQRPDLLTQLGSAHRLDERLQEVEAQLPLLEQLLAQGQDIRLDEDGELVVTPLRAEELSPEVAQLRALLTASLPRAELTEVLVEVDQWTGFSAELTGLDQTTPRAPEHQALLYAALLANACHISLREMAQSTGLDYQSLCWVAANYLREDTLKRATTRLVNHQHRQWLAQHWGGGTLSSSDGQRFPVSGKIRNARAIPRYFGYGQGLTFYTHTADQYAQFGSRAISSTTRDATYVLDEVLGNETELPLLEHTTDTHGYTDIVFALFDLLGLQFSPRLRDLANQRLCRIKGRELSYPSLKFTAHFNPAYVRQHWDDLLRVAGSLKTGWVSASLLISKLQAYPRQHHLTHLLQEYGRLVKTAFILRYLHSPPLRRRIHAQLNKGEQLHALRSWLWFGGDGVLRQKQEEAQQEVVRCLNVVTNVVVVWNTVYAQLALQRQQATGHLALPEHLAQLSPARFAHLNRLGRYSFQLPVDVLVNGLRPLRTLP